jgi:hypothetical protein
MTSSRYLLARVAHGLRIRPQAQRMGDAASEMHLLREAEAQLGAAIWEKVETSKPSRWSTGTCAS